MNGLVMIVREGCPYCERAEESLAAAIAAHPELSDTEIIKVDAESGEAEKYDFFYSPAFFLNGRKLSEGESGFDAAVSILERAREEKRI